MTRTSFSRWEGVFSNTLLTLVLRERIRTYVLLSNTSLNVTITTVNCFNGAGGSTVHETKRSKITFLDDSQSCRIVVFQTSSDGSHQLRNENVMLHYKDSNQDHPEEGNERRVVHEESDK